MTALSPAMSRIAAIGLLALVVFGAWAAIVAPVINSRENAKLELRQLELLRAGFSRALRDRAYLEAQVINLRERRDWQSFSFEGASAALVGAQIQTVVRELVAQSGSELRTTANLPVVSTAGYQKLGLRIELRASLQSVAQLLREMETHVPFLFIEGISLRGEERAAREGTVRDVLLSVRLDVSAFMMVEGAS